MGYKNKNQRAAARFRHPRKIKVVGCPERLAYPFRPPPRGTASQNKFARKIEKLANNLHGDKGFLNGAATPDDQLHHPRWRVGGV